MNRKFSQAIRRIESDVRDRDEFYWPDYPQADADIMDEDHLPIYYYFLRMTEHQIWQDDLVATITDALRYVNMEGDLQLTRSRLIAIASAATRFAELMIVADLHESLAKGAWPRRRARRKKTTARS